MSVFSWKLVLCVTIPNRIKKKKAGRKEKREEVSREEH